ncbi:hypothetical protein D3C79_977430 [compost metagenome]
MPTLAPSRARASARLAAVVDLPTPPLPEATAMTFLTLAMAGTWACALCAATTQSIVTWAELTPSRFSIAVCSTCAQPFLNKPAAYPSCSCTATCPPWMSMARTQPALTGSWFR